MSVNTMINDMRELEAAYLKMEARALKAEAALREIERRCQEARFYPDEVRSINLIAVLSAIARTALDGK
jgi:hypothetical protein